MTKRLAISVVLLLAITGCAPRESATAGKQPTSTPFDLTNASDKELKEHLGEHVAIHGRFSLFGKIGPYILVGERAIYLAPHGSFSWGKRYSDMEGREVRVIGTLRFAHYPDPPPGDSLEGRPFDHFYFEAETARVELSER